jgi:pyruvate/2-oxoglutarate dehydrogenase complex dihydrolipoamide dehydrogenase (E3) component
MEVSKAFQKILTKQGIEFKLEHKVISADKSANSIKVNIESAKNPNAKETVNIFLLFFLKLKQFKMFRVVIITIF